MEINTIPEAFQTKLRLAVLSALLTGTKSFKELKEITSATDGNLGIQLNKLSELQYLTIEKAFVNNKPLTTYTITEFGRSQFKEYVELLESLLSNSIDK